LPKVCLKADMDWMCPATRTTDSVLAGADRDRQFPRVGHSTTGEPGGTSAAGQCGRHISASPPPAAKLQPVRSGRYGRVGYSDATIWQRGPDAVLLAAFVLLLATLASCGGSEPPPQSPNHEVADKDAAPKRKKQMLTVSGQLGSLDEGKV